MNDNEPRLVISRDDPSAGKPVNIKENSRPPINLRLGIENKRRPAPHTAPPPQHQQQYKPTPPVPRVNPAANRIPMESFTDFINPKKKIEEHPQEEEEFYDDDMMGSDGGGQGHPGGDYGDEMGSEMMSEGGEGEYETYAERPSIGYNTIEEEKTDIILKLHRLKTKGFPVTRNFTMSSDIHEMRVELDKIKYNIDLESSIKFQRKILMAVVSTLEFANNRWDPFDIALNGWSESVYENVGDYDNCFERLWLKYRSKASLPAEIELIMTLGGSAFMYSMSQTMFKNVPTAVSDVIKNNPDMMTEIMKQMASGGQGNAATTQTDTRQQAPSQTTTQVPTYNPNPNYEMKIPDMNLFSAPQNIQQPSTFPTRPENSRPVSKSQPPPPPSIIYSDIMSDLDSIPDSAFSEQVKNVVISSNGKGKKKNDTRKILNL